MLQVTFNIIFQIKCSVQHKDHEKEEKKNR